MECFVCKQKLSDTKVMSNHFKLFHGLSEKGTYKCTFENACDKYFSSFGNLVRHFKASHQKPNTPERSNRETSFPTELFSIGSTNNDCILDPPNSPASHSSLSSSTSITTNETVDFDHIPDVKNSAFGFSLKLHNNANFTRQDVTGIQKDVVQSIIQPLVTSFKHFVESNFINSFEDQMNVSSFIGEITSSLQNSMTEHQLNQWLFENDLICDFKLFKIDSEISEKYQNGQIKYAEIDTTGVLLPLRFQFRKIFEKNDQILKSLKDMENIMKNRMQNSHFIQSSLWRQKSKSYVDSNKIILPYFLYMDDCEINNPLGSHADPISFLYYSFPVIDNCEIFLAAAMKSRDYKKFGNEKCLINLVNEIKILEREGIEIRTSKGIKTVHFVLGLFLGDNLGLNTALGFSSFSANFYCRFCKSKKMTSHMTCVSNPDLLRNAKNYEEDVAAQNVSLTGIKENSIFNSIDSFHTTTNYAIDVMHDIFEGVCHYDLCHIIKYCIRMSYFDLERLNNRKQMFNYGELEIGNISPVITTDNLNAPHLKMTAREMMTFIHIFPLIVGDLIPYDDEVWIFLLNLIQIIEILLFSEIPHDLAQHLKSLIKAHHTDYIRLFNDTLKPKHHLMIHYDLIISKSGPPRNFWCFRYEAEHKKFKSYARATSSRKNICFSLAKKFQFKFANLLIQEVPPPFIVEPYHRIESNNENLIRNFCEQNYIDFKYQEYSECVYRSKKFKRGFFVSQYVDIDISNVSVLEIIEIISFVGHEIPYVICKRVKIKEYHAHYSAYEIDDTYINETLNANNCSIWKIDAFAGPPVNSHRTARGLNLIRPKQYF